MILNREEIKKHIKVIHFNDAISIFILLKIKILFEEKIKTFKFEIMKPVENIIDRLKINKQYLEKVIDYLYFIEEHKKILFLNSNYNLINVINIENIIDFSFDVKFDHHFYIEAQYNLMKKYYEIQEIVNERHKCH